MLQVIFIIYAVGLICGICLLVLASFVEPTSRARRELWTLGLLGVLLWPIGQVHAIVRHRSALKRLARSVKAR